MNILPKVVEDLIESLAIFPGIGKKTATRLAFFLIKENDESRRQIANSIDAIGSNLKNCKICHNFSSSEICELCLDSNRNKKTICVVESPFDILAIESTNTFNGKYHVLNGLFSPLDGIGEKELNISSLIKRIKNEEISEVLLAISANLEGDATATLIKNKCSQISNLKITKIARGLPVGGELGYTDEATLCNALNHRIELL